MYTALTQLQTLSLLCSGYSEADWRESALTALTRAVIERTHAEVE